jgi:hypothetical protein
MEVRQLALEPELNDAIVVLSGTDFLFADVDLEALFLDCLGKYYSEDVVLWFQDQLTQGKQASFQRMAGAVELIHMLFETGMATIETFRVTAIHQGPHGEFNSDWEMVLDGAHITGTPIRWRTTRVWKGQSVVAERIHSLP